MSKEYFNQIAATWDEVAAEKDSTKLERLARSLDIEPGATVLDVGTGTGVFVPFLLKKIGSSGRLVCLDSAEAMLKKAKAKGFKGNIEYLNADVTDVPLPDEVCDAVVCYSSFPHFRDKPRALAEINRLLRKDGRLFICHTSSQTKINRIHRQIPVLSNDLIPENSEMREMLIAADFVDGKIRENNESYLACASKEF